MSDKFGRAEWKNYNMAVAMLITSRSIDPRTKHGCYIVAPNNRPLITGYNGPIRGIDDNKFSLDPPDKYYQVVHAEANCICNFNGSLEGATAYVTGYPCSTCFKLLAQKGVSKIVYGPISSIMLDENNDECKSIKKMIEYSNVEVVKFDGDIWEPFLLMIKYLATKGVTPNVDFINEVSKIEKDKKWIKYG